MIRETYPAHKIIFDAACAGWYALAGRLRPAGARRGSHAAEPWNDPSRAIVAGLVFLCLAGSIAGGSAYGRYLSRPDVGRVPADGRGGLPTRPPVPAPGPTGAYDGAAPVRLPDATPLVSGEDDC